SFASMILIPMDLKQAQHLKAYGIAYWVLQHNVTVDWMLNYRGGSFAFPYSNIFESECMVRGVTYELVPDAQYNAILGIGHQLISYTSYQALAFINIRIGESETATPVVQHP